MLPLTSLKAWPSTKQLSTSLTTTERKQQEFLWWTPGGSSQMTVTLSTFLNYSVQIFINLLSKNVTLSISSSPFETCFGQRARCWTDRLHSEEQDIQLLLIRGMRPPDIPPPPDEQNHDGPWDALEKTGGGLWVQRRSALLWKYLWSWDQLHSGSQHGTGGQLRRQQFVILQQVNRQNMAPNHNAVLGQHVKNETHF